jgi:hypothetical protein
LVEVPGVVNQVLVAVHAFLLVTRTGIQDGSVGQHGATFIGYIEDISMTFLALLILEGGIGLLAILLVVVFLLDKVGDDILYAVECLGIKEIKGVVGGREVAVHTVCHKALGIIDMG